MAEKILLINQGNALMVNTLLNLLKRAEIETIHIAPEPAGILSEGPRANAIMLFAGDYIYDARKLLIFLKKMCADKGKPLCVMGTEEEIAEIEKTIPKDMIARAFARPADVKNIAAELGSLVRSGGSDVQKKHILLVDDDVMFLQAMRNWLSVSYKISATKSGAQAISYLAKNHPDLILLDYEMPLMSGPEVLEKIRSDPNCADIPVFFLTGRNDSESTSRVIELGPEGFLLKSMSQTDIIAAVDRFFDR